MVRLSVEEAWAFWRDKLESPKYILAPMVNASEIQFRILCRRYGVKLAYTPMLHSRMLYESRDYLSKMHPSVKDLPSLFESENHDLSEKNRAPEKYELPKTIAQVCGYEPEVVVRGCQLIEDSVLAVDLNCGCPQGIAKRGHYGSYLLEKPEIILSIVKAMVDNLKIPVTVKIRIIDEIPQAEETAETKLLEVGGMASYRQEEIVDLCSKTFSLISELEKLGVAAICVHGRTMKNKGQDIRAAEWGLIKEIVSRSKIPIIANGSVRTKEDADACLKFTGAAAVMSAVGLLSNPAMFSENREIKMTKLMRELCYLYENLKVESKTVYSAPLKGHVFHALHGILQKHTELRTQLDHARGVAAVKKICDEAALYEGEEIDILASYYYRHSRKKTEHHSAEPAALGPPGSPSTKKSRLLHAEQENQNNISNKEDQSQKGDIVV